MRNLTQKKLKSLFEYDPRTGIFVRKKSLKRNSQWNGRYAGKKAGVMANGYLKVGIDYHEYLLHHLAWLYVMGSLPECLDHIDGDRTNNRFSNLRVADKSQNGCNRIKQINNTSGYKGVSFNKRLKKWHARICIQKKDHHIGFFTDPKIAYAAYCKKAKELHGEFARTE